ncbi:hypothetical protein A4H97_16170 [Niastella yeongjuensis]|uniref:Uncharacterized protein n=1 Tax=Niastella yeongjuensis TaxID=354355 RepID=A0A1V9E0X6_9BACT|nr:hypothetical protein [Niastella yeongjuensis]OQP39760.1 hypothetical protein A4H97_16170 [Niastella yeongjuensis]SEO04381.1 hypothetical protein SAMN05660816_01980 [Niastella yeongjuensis]
MKRIILFSTVLCLLALSFAGCKKEEISPTHAVQTENELKALIEKNRVQRIYPLPLKAGFPNQFPASQGTAWSFSNGFIYMHYNGSIPAYNLDYLVYYAIQSVAIDNGTSEPSLILYMDIP